MFLVPLAFSSSARVPFNEYKSFVLHASAVVLAFLLAIHSARHIGSIRVQCKQLQTFRAWYASPRRVLVQGFLLLVVGYVLAAVLSPDFRISYFGFSENYSGNSLYDVLSLTVILTSTAVLLRKSDHINGLLLTLAAVGTMIAGYGLLQSMGWDPIGGREGLNRPVSSFGNTLNFAGFLTVSAPAVLFLGSNSKSSDKWLLIFGSALGIQIAGLWISGGRAAIVSSAAALVMVGLLNSRYFGGSRDKAVVTCVGVGLSVAVAAVVITGATSSAGSRLADAGGDIGSLLFEDGTTSAGNIGTRVEIWGSAFKSIVQPPLPDAISPIPPAIRFVVGHGPEFFGVTYPFTGNSNAGLEPQFHTHNLVLTVVTSAGLIGIVALVLIGVGYVWLTKKCWSADARAHQRRRRASLTILFVVIGVAKIVEMQTSVPRISDLLPTAVILGLLIGTNSASESIDDVSKFTRARQPLTVSTVAIPAVIGVVLLISFVGYDLRRISTIPTLASPEIRDSAASRRVLESRAADIGSSMLRLSEKNFDRSQKLFDEGNFTDSYDEAIVAWELMLAAEEINQFKFETRFALAKIAITQVQRGDSSFTDQAIERYSALGRDFKAFPTILGTAATALASLGQYETAIELANEAIAVEPSTKPWSKAWYAKGISEYELGMQDEGIESLVTATEKEPTSVAAKSSHHALAHIYSQRGEIGLADFHAAEAAD